MNFQEDDLLRDLYGGDFEYHQDYRGDGFHWLELLGIFVPVLVLALGLIYTGLYTLDFNLLPLPELVWNCIVYVTPLRLLDFIDNDRMTSAMDDSSFHNIPRTHAAKSELMRRLFGFDRSSGIIGTVAQASRRRLSSFSGINIGTQAGDGCPPGLGNWDNSCYQNSVLQGLASLDTLSGYLKDPLVSSFHGEAVAANSDLKMADSLRDLIARLKDPSNNGKRIWTPATLKSMSSWQQQDAQEYFSKILDEIDKEIAKAVKAGSSPKGLESGLSLPEVSTKGEEIGTQESVLAYGVGNPLEGLLAQRVGCTRCGYSEGLSMIPFNCLTVPLGKAWYYDISECLDEYTKLEPIEGVECGKCTLLKTQRLLSIILERIKESAEDNQVRISTMNRLRTIMEALEEDDYDDKTLTQKCNLPPKNRMSTTKSRQAVISRPPKSLAVHINRSLFDERTGELKKNYAEVTFPTILDLGPWCLGSRATSTDTQCEEWLLDPEQPMVAGSQSPSRIRGPIYELRAVVTHYGRHENGHYICYRKHPVVRDSSEKILNEEQWWRLSDDDVTQVNEENVLGQGGVFMLFYDCIEPASMMAARVPSADLTSSVEITGSIALAASVPLPVESNDDLDSSDLEDQDSSKLSQGQIIPISISETGDDDSVDDQEYHPTKAILIPPRIQPSGSYNNEEIKQHAVRSQGNMLMV